MLAIIVDATGRTLQRLAESNNVKQTIELAIPPMLIRTALLRPLDQETGAAPHRIANAAASRVLHRFPACPTNPAAVTVDTPCIASSSGTIRRRRGRSIVSMLLIRSVVWAMSSMAKSASSTRASIAISRPFRCRAAIRTFASALRLSSVGSGSRSRRKAALRKRDLLGPFTNKPVSLIVSQPNRLSLGRPLEARKSIGLAQYGLGDRPRVEHVRLSDSTRSIAVPLSEGPRTP